MKKIKLVLLAIISIVVFNINASAKTGEGLCYGKELNSYGYCQIDPVSIGHTSFSYAPITLDNGASAAAFRYYGTIEGEKQDMFCIDPNLGSPKVAYGYARPLNLNNNYDRAIAKAYDLYINAVVAEMKNGKGYDDAVNQYLQIVNVVMRAITSKYKYDISNGHKDNNFDIVANQLEGNNPSGLKLTTGSNDYNIVQRWYCSSIITGKDRNIVSQKTVDFCKKVSGVNDSSPKQISVGLAIDTANIKSSGNADTFEREIPVKITGLSDLLKDYQALSHLDSRIKPKFAIKSVTCENKKLNCSLKNPTLIGTNLLDIATDPEYAIEVLVTGNTKDFLNESSAKVNIAYEYSHIFNSNNLAVLRYHMTKQNEQRMIVLMPNKPQNQSVNITVNIPSMCKAEIIEGEQVYTFGSEELSEKDYLEGGCCNVDPKYLKDQASIDYYLENCSAGVYISLDTDCRNDGIADNFSHSQIYQDSMKNIMKNVSAAEAERHNGRYDDATLKKQLEEYKYNRDDEYLRTSSSAEELVVAANNSYCKLYTSEQQDIYYPGTIEAKSGRYFVFVTANENGEKTYIQPYVDGNITANFHTDYKRWQSDHKVAVDEEKKAYTEYQTALQEEASITKAKEKSSSCSAGDDNCCTTYSANVSGYYNADRNAISSGASWTEGTCESAGSEPDPQVSMYKSKYEEKYKARVLLETYKKQCESKSKVATNWNYYLEPELTFSYKQKFLNTSNNLSEYLTETVDLKISTSEEKYWPKVTKEPEQVSKSGSPVASTASVSYGRNATGGYAVSESFAHDVTTDYSVVYKQTLYYIPEVKYYSLLPDGKYVTEEQITQSTNYLDVGYVFNVKLTTYQGEYETWFDIKHMGHLMQSPTIKPKPLSNIQILVNQYLEDHAEELNLKNVSNKTYVNKCYYSDEEILFQTECPLCTDVENGVFKPQYFSRVIASTNLNPSERTLGVNWSDPKGVRAKELIESAGDSIYDDRSEFLEYSFTLGPNEMADIKKNVNRETDETTYGDFKLSNCVFGKQCESPLLTALADSSGTLTLLEKTRTTGWKYYINGDWVRGSIKEDLVGGVYPDEPYVDEASGISYWP